MDHEEPHKDRVYRERLEVIPPFAFNTSVAEVFDDMAARSIPLYEVVQDMTADLASQFVDAGSVVYDLGCSTGTTMLRLREVLRARNVEGARLIGIDSSEAMCARARRRVLQGQDYLNDTVIYCADLRDIQLQPASVVIMNYTLQFLRPQERARVVSRVYASLRPGGAFLVSDKTLQSSTAASRAFAEVYYEFKRSHGYSDLEIAQKREALENVLVPYRTEEEVDLLRGAGFDSVDQFFCWCNFSSFICIKNGLSR